MVLLLDEEQRLRKYDLGLLFIFSFRQATNRLIYRRPNCLSQFIGLKGVP